MKAYVITQLTRHSVSLSGCYNEALQKKNWNINTLGPLFGRVYDGTIEDAAKQNWNVNRLL